ncbi:MAG: hypothetical protein ABSH28_15200 [Acidobacteriota bacterium]
MSALRIFFSSRGDVGEERLLAQQVVERLQAEFAAFLRIESVFWEHEPLRATANFQEQIPLPAQSDIVVFIFWARLGTRLPANITDPTGAGSPRARNSSSKTPSARIANEVCRICLSIASPLSRLPCWTNA